MTDIKTQMINVITYGPDNDDPETDFTWDIFKPWHRKKLNDHLTWAMCNNRMVEIEPVGADDT